MKNKLSIFILFCLCTVNVFSQNYLIKIIPETVLAYDEFSVVIELPSIISSQLEAITPEYYGKAQYKEAKISSIVKEDGKHVTTIAYIFIAKDEEKFEITNLSVLVSGRTINFDPLYIDIFPNKNKLISSWIVPEKIYQYDEFEIFALANGKKIPLNGLSVNGMRFEPDNNEYTEMKAMATHSGNFKLPQLNFENTTVPPKTFFVTPIPEEAENCSAIGKSYSVSLNVSNLSNNKVVSQGESIPIIAQAIGKAWPSLSIPPKLSISIDDDEDAAFSLTEYSNTKNGFCVSGISGAINCSKPGTYKIQIMPYLWFDTTSGTIKTATAKEIIFFVKEKQEIIQQYDKASLEYVEEYAQVLAQRKSFNPPRDIDKKIEFYNKIFGNQSPSKFVLPIPLVCIVITVLLFVATLFLLIIKLIKKRKATNKNSNSTLMILTVCLFLLSTIITMASFYERSEKEFVSKGSIAKKVPNEMASNVFEILPGNIGRILEDTGYWVFVELIDGQAFWIKKDTIILF